MTSDRDIDELFRKFTELDAELKELKKEVSEIKWYQQHGTKGTVAYSAAYLQPSTKPSWPIPQWEEDLEK